MSPSREKSCTLAIKAIPHAPHSAVMGWLGDAPKVKVHAPTLEGQANEGLCALLARELGLARRTVTLVRSHTSQQKFGRIEDLTLDAIKARFLPATDSAPSVLSPDR